MKKSPKAKKPPAPLPVNPASVPEWAKPKPKTPEYIDNLPEHLSAFGRAIWRDRDTCRKLLVGALETYDDAVYDAVINATPKEVLDVMKKGREAILTHVDSILSIACDCAGDHVRPPSTLAGVIEEEAPREAGETIGAVLSDMRAINQREFLQGFLFSLTPDARGMLEAWT